MTVYADRVVLDLGGKSLVFLQGPMSPAAVARYDRIQTAMREGWLNDRMSRALNPELLELELAPEWLARLRQVADGMNEKYGRAMAATAALQMAIKAIAPDQSIRLTKGRAPSRQRGKGRSGAARDDFSWVEGISMRSLSQEFMVGFLRENKLVRGNKFGPFMTRSFAENYPYSPLYKAVMRGPQPAWLEVIEGLEDGSLNPEAAFIHLCAMLSNRSNDFEKLAKQTLSAVDLALTKKPTLEQVMSLIGGHLRTSVASARLLEIAMHSLLQCTVPHGENEGFDLRPLGQMRTANKKMGNVGDIELLEAGTTKVVEAWDAKSGKKWALKTEIEELTEKLEANPGVRVAGFVLDNPPAKDPLQPRLTAELRNTTGADLVLQQFPEWVSDQARRSGLPPAELAAQWLRAYAESLCQRRPAAPIDEPCGPWVQTLQKALAG